MSDDPTQIKLPWQAMAIYYLVLVIVGTLVVFGAIRVCETLFVDVPSGRIVILGPSGCVTCDKVREGLESDCGVPHQFHQ